MCQSIVLLHCLCEYDNRKFRRFSLPRVSKNFTCPAHPRRSARHWIKEKRNDLCYLTVIVKVKLQLFLTCYTSVVNFYRLLRNCCNHVKTQSKGKRTCINTFITEGLYLFV